MFLRKFRQ